MTVNKCILVGNLGQDPEKRVMNSGDSVVNVSMATTEKWKDKQGNKQQKTEWHKLIFYAKLADLAEQFLSKGSQLYIEGKIQTREWEKDGVKKYTTEIVVQQMSFLGGGKQGQQSQQSSQQQQSPPSNSQAPPNVPSNDFIEDDVPY